MQRHPRRGVPFFDCFKTMKRKLELIENRLYVFPSELQERRAALFGDIDLSLQEERYVSQFLREQLDYLQALDDDEIEF